METIQPGFDLNLLRVLVTLDDKRNVTQAAQALEMSQSGFSTALARLRKHFDDPLFVRTVGGMKPSPRAQVMVETARQVLAQVQEGILDAPVFEPASAQGTLRLAMADVAEIVFVPRLLRHLQQVAPHLDVRTQALPRDTLRLEMEGGTVDTALGFFPELGTSNFFQQRLYQHTYACMLRPGHPVLKSGLTTDTYLELGHAVVSSPARSTDFLEEFLARKRIVRRVVFETPHHMSLPAIMEQTDLIATVPLATCHRYARLGAVVVAALPIDPPLFNVSQFWHRRVHHDARSRWLRAQVSSLFNDETDEWRELERSLYGDLRSNAGARRRSAGSKKG